MFEITAGVGGQEAMIFTEELFEMYNAYAHYKGWKSEIADYCHTDIGNIVDINLFLNNLIFIKLYEVILAKQTHYV